MGGFQCTLFTLQNLMKVYCQLVIMAIYLCHNYIHTALTYIIPVILINSLSILWSNSTMDAQISKLANLLSAHILYAHMHRKDNFCYPVFIINKNKILTAKKCIGHWWNLYVLDLNFSCCCLSAVWGGGWEDCSKAGFWSVKNVIWIWRINNIYWLLPDG